jgi:CBS domain-containing membrane protein
MPTSMSRPSRVAAGVAPSRVRLGWYVLGNGFVAIAVLAAIAQVFGLPFIFPSLGPTVWLLLTAPTIASTAPRSVLGGHLVGIAAGYAALLAFGLTDVPPDMQGMSGERVGAAALSLSLTLALMVWLDLPHAPAAATTLIVGLGLIREPLDLLVMLLAVALLVAHGFAVNRLAGVRYPAWRPRVPRPGPAPAIPPPPYLPTAARPAGPGPAG